MIRFLLVLAVLALGADALLFSGAYTQSVWSRLSGYAVTLGIDPRDPASREAQPATPETPPGRS